MRFSFIEKYKRRFNDGRVKELINHSVYCEDSCIRLLNKEPIINNKNFSILLATKTEANIEHDDE